MGRGCCRHRHADDRRRCILRPSLHNHATGAGGANPTTLHLSGEFIESNLGSAVEPGGSVTVRAIGQQFSFTPQCIVVPTDTTITLRATSADVVHGL